jgi:hypothetical protein
MQTDPDAPERPTASWVMGRSTRWHDPAFQAELAMAEVAGDGRRRSLPLAAGLGVGLTEGPTGVLVAFRLVRLVTRLVRHTAWSGRYR